MSELKRCPFCGGEAWLREFNALGGATNYYVECGYIECGVHAETAIFETPEKVSWLYVEKGDDNQNSIENTDSGKILKRTKMADAFIWIV